MIATPSKAFPTPEFADCPHCNAPVKLYDPVQSEFCVCKACYAYIRFVNEEPILIRNFKKLLYPPVIPIGAEGTIQGHPFKVMAYIEKKEANTEYSWREYIILNPEKGYATLSEFDGHWNIIYDVAFVPALEHLLAGGDYFMVDGAEYKLFHKYSPVITALVGEFQWDLLSENLSVTEFIRPPFLLVKEKNTKGKRTDYYRGEYLQPSVIAAAFGLDAAVLPAREGILSNQPSAAASNLLDVIKILPLAIIAMLVLQLFIGFFKPSELLLNDTYNISLSKETIAKLQPLPVDSLTADGTLSGPTLAASADLIVNPATGPLLSDYEYAPFVTPAFTVKDASSAVEFEIFSNVNNNWLEATIVLVNETTNQTWEVSKGIEYYEGYEDGSTWSEGSKKETVLLSDIPGGKYHLNVYTASGDRDISSLNIKVEANITLWRNLLVSALALCIVPFIMYLLRARFEKKRWENSDYSPYHQ